MIPVSRLTDQHACPIPLHGLTPLVSGSPTVYVNGLPVARIGDRAGCGAVIVSGFVHILVDGRPMAHMGSLTSHGGGIVTGSHDTAGGQVRFDTQNLAVDFALLGAIDAQGNVDEQTLQALLADPQLEQRAQAAGALVQPNDAPFPKAPATDLPEMIAVAGSQHDNGAGNKMMFIGQAVRQLRVFKEQYPARPRTLVVFTPHYSEAMLDAARKSAGLYTADFKTLDTAQALIDYINTGRDRSKHPVAQLDLFSHGVPLSIAFGHHLENEADMALDVDNFQLLAVNAFSPEARITSYACRTGMGNPQDMDIENAVQLNPQPKLSLAQKLADHLKIPVGAFITRSDYKETWGSFVDRRRAQVCPVTNTVLPDDEWCDEWGALMKDRKRAENQVDVLYQSGGAINPVTSGTTPHGPSMGIIEFKPNE
ncbi:hypothetical protein PS3A_50620 [Pseudomonas sp. 3A(2025)]